jgi:hypothetical protein
MAELHALIVGVSAYPHLPGGDGQRAENDYGMSQLTASAASAKAIHDWLAEAGDRLSVPLGSARLLLSPSPLELERDPGLAEARPATRESLIEAAIEWREACAEDPGNVALFYFAGHGVERTRSDAVLLSSDFGAVGGNPLLNAVDVNNLFGGMAPTARRPRMATTQLWLVDSCRVFPKEFDNFETLRATEVFEVDLADLDRRSAPVYLGSHPGGPAFAVTGERTLFSEALLESLNCSGGRKLEGSRDKWIVTAGSLHAGMVAAVDRLNAAHGTKQVILGGGQLEYPDPPIVELAGVPEVDVSVELVPAAGGIALSFHDSSGNQVLAGDPLHPNPYRDRWKAGSYRLQATPPLHGVAPEVPVRPPRFDWKAEVR